MSNLIDITGIDKVDLLRRLWSNQQLAPFYTSGVGMLDGPPAFDEKKAQDAVTGDIDYFCDVYIKTDLSGDIVDPFFYDQDAGAGTMQSIVDEIRLKNKIKACMHWDFFI